KQPVLGSLKQREQQHSILARFLPLIQPFDIAIGPDLAMMRQPPSSEESHRERRSFADSQDRLWLRHVSWTAG
ncbi:hypothetical protein, partial [Agrobacterium arsenijevicii]|uniref:hypothetical protein n=1 Tax=Agrobacterium arsenijevicii TaxID=1585697 RepID=UPI00330615EE